MLELKIRKFGNALGVLLPKVAIQRLGVKEGDKLLLLESPDGYRLTRNDQRVAQKSAKVEDLMDRYRETLRVLSK